MMVLSEGTPMTNGEVFALLRRRRDERNAKMHLQFGLQIAGGGSNSLSAAPGTSLQKKTFFPPDVLLKELQGPGSRLSTRDDAFFASPSVSHIVVLLTELRTLFYLSRYATVSGCGGVHALYGPTSVQSRRSVENGLSNGGDDVSVAQEKGSNEEGEQKDEVLVRVMWRHRSGSVGRVRAVEALLDMWETNGREAERLAAAKVMEIHRTLMQRLNHARCSNGGTLSLVHRIDKDELKQQRPSFSFYSSDQARLAFASPSMPLASRLARRNFSAFATDGAVNRDGCAAESFFLEGSQQWTEQDVLRLVIGRPKNGLDVHRLVDSIEQMTGLNEDLLAFVEEELVKVFL